MKQIIVTKFNNRPFVDLDQVQHLIQGMQTDIDVLEAQLHAEIVGKEQMIVCYESQLQEMILILKNEIKSIKDTLLPLRDLESDYKLDEIEYRLKYMEK